MGVRLFLRLPFFSPDAFERKIKGAPPLLGGGPLKHDPLRVGKHYKSLVTSGMLRAVLRHAIIYSEN